MSQKIIGLIIIQLFLCTWSLSAWSQDFITLERAVYLAVENQPMVLQARADVTASKAAIEQNRSLWYPNISGTAQYSRVGPVPEISLPGGESFELFPENNYDLHIGLSQNVYDFGRRSRSTDLAESYSQSAFENVNLIKSNLAYQTIVSFNTILFLREDISVIDQQIDALKEHLPVTQKKERTGSATNFDVLTTQVRLSAAQTQRIEIANTLQKQETVFRRLTGLPQDEGVQLEGDFQIPYYDLNPDSLISVALNQVPEIKLSKDAEKSAEIQHRVASLGYYPFLNANLQYGFKNGYFPDLDVLRGNWVAGIQLQVPIFNGYLTKNRIEGARANVSKARAHTKEVEDRVVAGVIQAVADVGSNRDKLQAAEPQVEQAQEAVSMAEIRYNAGVVTNLDVLDAETALANARLVHLRASYDLVISHYSLQYAVGNRFWQ